MKTAARTLLAVFLVIMGVLHFVADDLFAQVVPPFLPWPLGLVWISGVAEIVLGLALLAPPARELAAWGIIALLIAVYPANIYMAVADLRLEGLPEGFAQPSRTALWLRLPLQFVMMAWAWWCTRPDESPA